MAQKITGDMIIGDILDIDNGCSPIFLEAGMHCLGCPAARGETLAEACEIHDIDADLMVNKLNAYFEALQ